MDFDPRQGVVIRKSISSPLDLLGSMPDMPVNWWTTPPEKRLPMTAYKVVTVKTLNRAFGWK